MTTRFLAGGADNPESDEVVPEPIASSATIVEDFEVLGPADVDDYLAWEWIRQRGDPPGAPDEEPDFEDDGSNEEGGVLWVARGATEVIVAAEDEDSIDCELLQGALPTALDSTDFDGPAEVADWT